MSPIDSSEEGIDNIKLERDHLAAQVKVLEAQVAGLETWKAEALAVEMQWNIQVVASLITPVMGLKIGDPIRPAIEPAIRRLLENQKDAGVYDNLQQMMEVIKGAHRELDEAIYSIDRTPYHLYYRIAAVIKAYKQEKAKVEQARNAIAGLLSSRHE